jgi:acetylornithine/succinyldiaminopimelate/putrescine aminotransferase
MSKEEYASLTPGNHGSTFGGNPLAMAAVKAVLGVVDDPAFLEEVRFKGRILENALSLIADRIPGAEVRGEGLLLGLDLEDPELARQVFEHCLDEGVLVNLVAGTTVRLAPPLTVTRAEIRYALDTIRAAIDDLVGVPVGVLTTARPQSAVA